MKDKKKICLLLIALILLVFFVTYTVRSNTTKLKQELTSMNFLELLRAGYDLKEGDRAFSEICQLLNDTLLRKKDFEFRLMILTHILVIDSIVHSIDWTITYNDHEIGPTSARLTFYIDISENNNIKIQGNKSSIFNLQNLARDYIFYPDSAARKIVNRSHYIQGIGDIEASFASPIINLHLPKNNSLSLSEWRFFFECVRELIELYEDERNKTSLRIFNRDYSALSFADKEKIADVAGYNIFIEIIR